jgi:hypothetical protein
MTLLCHICPFPRPSTTLLSLQTQLVLPGDEVVAWQEEAGLALGHRIMAKLEP